MSKNPLLWKFILILAVIIAAAFFFYPPEERINLGLDLRGGLHILMQVETGTALTYHMNLTTDRLGQEFKSKNLTYASIVPPEEATLEVRGTDPARRVEVRQVLDDFVGRWQILEVGNGTWRIKLPPDAKSHIESNAIEVTLSILRKRIDSLGVSSPTVQTQGIRGDRILIQLPGVEDPERVKGILGEPAVLEWKAVSYPPAAADPSSWFPPDTKETLIAQFGGALPDDTLIYPQEFPKGARPWSGGL